MSVVQGTVRNGQVIPDEPMDFREGTRVEIYPVEAHQFATGMREEVWPTTPEGIMALLARMDSVGPSWISSEDDVAWRSDLRRQKQEEKSIFLADAEKLKGMWE